MMFIQVYEIGSVPVNGLLRVRRGDTVSVGLILSDASGTVLDLTGFTAKDPFRAMFDPLGGPTGGYGW